MKTHCLKINTIPAEAPLRCIREWEDELMCMHDKFPYGEDQEKVYFEGTEQECEEALEKLDYRVRDLFKPIVLIDYEVD